ncbi:MAG: NAD-dependent epimerase/dehydratase family protein [Bacteroidota bacterium]|nr:NAD-dependent epimerase/dehydratase family protein [Bacteroidota bacterium]
MNFITGATGLIGSHLTAHLLMQGKDVIALKRVNSNTKNIEEILSFYTTDYKELFKKIRFVEGDITDIYSLLDVLDNIEQVYHCAGMVNFEEKRIKELLLINSEGTANMVNACLEKGIQQFCHVSSVATMPNHDKKAIVDESVFWKSSPENGAYAISKYNGEREVWRAAEEGLNVCIVNPSVVLGAGCWGQSSSRLIAECYKGTRFFTNGVTGFVDVKDVVHCMIGLMDQTDRQTGKKINGKRFVVSGDNQSFKYVLDQFHTAFGKKLPSIEAGKWILKTGALLEKIFSSEPRITKTTIDAALSKNYFSHERISTELNFNFTPLDQTITYVAEKYKNYRTNN